MEKKAIIFDLYDTLIETRNKTNPYLYLLANCNNTNTKEIINDVMMNNYTSYEFILKLQKTIGPNSISVTEFNKLLDAELESTVTFKDTFHVLRTLKSKGYRMFLLSNLATPYKYPYYKLHLDVFIERAYFSCEEHDKKPNASFFQKVVDFSGLKKEEFLMIGDNFISDYSAANNFGMDALLKVNDLESLIKDLPDVKVK